MDFLRNLQIIAEANKRYRHYRRYTLFGSLVYFWEADTLLLSPNLS